MKYYRQLLVGAKLRYFYFWLGCGIALIIAVFYLSLTALVVPMTVEHTDKLIHGATYAIMMAWFIQLYRGIRSYSLLAIGFISMGAMIEVLQSFHPMRYFDVLDMLANAVGVLIVFSISGSSFSSMLEKLENHRL